MAKKIRLDFSKTEERSGFNTKLMPEGLHRMKIDGVEQREASDGTPMLVYSLVPTEAKYKTRRFPFYCKLQANQLWKLRDLLVAAGQSVPKKALQIDPEAVVGKEIAVELEDETNAAYEGRSTVNSTYSLDILDDGGSIASEGDDDDDEVEDDEAEGEDEVEAEEEAEDEEPALETLTLAELRKLAKSLGIVTTGLKTADLIEAIEEAEAEAEEAEDEDEPEADDEDELEEDDLDGEELYDDEEEAEEEPEPAPKRRVTPAAKPAARKAAPAAAPKRTVQRRR